MIVLVVSGMTTSLWQMGNAPQLSYSSSQSLTPSNSQPAENSEGCKDAKHCWISYSPSQNKSIGFFWFILIFGGLYQAVFYWLWLCWYKDVHLWVYLLKEKGDMLSFHNYFSSIVPIENQNSAYCMAGVSMYGIIH